MQTETQLYELDQIFSDVGCKSTVFFFWQFLCTYPFYSSSVLIASKSIHHIPFTSIYIFQRSLTFVCIHLWRLLESRPANVQCNNSFYSRLVFHCPTGIFFLFFQVDKLLGSPFAPDPGRLRSKNFLGRNNSLEMSLSLSLSLFAPSLFTSLLLDLLYSPLWKIAIIN